MNNGDEITIRPTELVAGGDALAKIDGFPIFAANVYPGDVALVRLYDVRKNFARGQLVRLVEPGPDRRLEPCPVADECGGCDWTALRLDAQLRAKERIVRESLRRVGKLRLETLPPIAIHPSPLNYRLRSRLHRDGAAIGFYGARSHTVVPLSEACEVVGVQTAKAFGRPSAGPPPASRPAAVAQDPHAEAAGPDDTAPRRDEQEFWEVGGTLVGTGDEAWGAGAIADASTVIKVTAGPYSWSVSPRGFFQVNRHLLGTMVDLVSGLASKLGERHSAVDLYAGAGFFTLPLSDLFEGVTAVEQSPLSHASAKLNARPNTKLINSAVEAWIPHMKKSDFVFLDPPRAGARPDVVDTVARRARTMVCYLSCDPVTFARDASRLIASGWCLSTLDLLDLFPNTHHVETLSSFERAS